MATQHNDRIVEDGFPENWFVQDRLDENAALLMIRIPGVWPGSRCICTRPKAMATDNWLPTARSIAHAMDAASRHEARQRSSFWTDFEEAEIVPMSREDAEEIALSRGLTTDAVLEITRREGLGARIYMNDIYLVQIRPVAEVPGRQGMVWLSIRRIDREPVGEEHFRDFQRIKNELVGVNCEAVELYPSEERLVDTANQYHLWCIRDPDIQFPFGMRGRSVSYDSPGNTKQRPR